MRKLKTKPKDSMTCANAILIVGRGVELKQVIEPGRLRLSRSIAEMSAWYKIILHVIGNGSGRTPIRGISAPLEFRKTALAEIEGKA